MAFDINSAVEVNENEAIPTTKFDISSAQDLNPPQTSGKEYPIASFLRGIFKNTVAEKAMTMFHLAGEAKAGTLSRPSPGEDFNTWLKRIEAEHDEEVISEGVVRQVAAPMTGMVAGAAIAAPVVTAVAVGAFSVADHFFNARRWIEENRPNTTPVIKEIAEILDFAAKGAIIGGGAHFGRKFVSERFGKLNLPKATKIEAEQVGLIKKDQALMDKLGIQPGQADVSVKTGTPIQISVEKAVEVATEPGWAKTQKKILPESEWTARQAGFEKARAGFEPGKTPFAKTTPEGATPPSETPIIPSAPVPIKPGEKAPPPEIPPATVPQAVPPGERIRGLSKSVEASAIKEELVKDFGTLPTYTTRNMDKVAQRVSEFINTNYELATKIAMRQAPEQGDMRAQEVFTGLRLKAMAEKDVATLKKLANSPEATSEATELGQRIKALDASDGQNPIAAIRQLKKLGINLKDAEETRLIELSLEASRLKSDTEKMFLDPKYIFKKETPEQLSLRLQYGKARVEFENYFNGIKDKAKRKALKDYVMPSNWGSVISDVAGVAKSMKASFDNSVIGRQGLKTLFTHPDVWAKNSAKSFLDFWKSMSGGDAMKEVRAEVLSRPNSLNGLYKKEGLAVGVREEAYPTSLPEKIPVAGKFFKGSQDAFTAWQYRTRADVFDRLVDVANKSNADIEGLGKVVNSLTGRGNIGQWEKVATPLNNIFFSPRFLKSNLDLLTVHAWDKNIGSFARKEAAFNLVKVTMGVATILGIAKTLNPDSVETDPRSANFGKIQIGDTRFDVSGGMSSIIVLASRIIPALWGQAASKSSTTGLVTPINSGRFGAKTGWDVLASFFEGKLSPAAGILRDVLKGKDFQGKRPTLSGELINLLAPLPITNAYELMNNPNSAPILLALISDALGFGTNTYGTDVDWSSRIGQELEQFHQKIGDEKFKEANKDFNNRFRVWFSKAKEDEKYDKLTEDEKGLLLNKKRNEIKDSIFRKYGFKFKPTKHKLPRIK